MLFRSIHGGSHDQQLSIQTTVNNQCFVPLDTASKGKELWEQTNRVSRLLAVLVGSSQPFSRIFGMTHVWLTTTRHPPQPHYQVEEGTRSYNWPDSKDQTTTEVE